MDALAKARGLSGEGLPQNLEFGLALVVANAALLEQVVHGGMYFFSFGHRFLVGRGAGRDLDAGGIGE